MEKKMEPPSKDEGFAQIVRLEDEEDVTNYLKSWGCKVVRKEEPNKLKIFKFPRTRHLVNVGGATRDDLIVNNETDYFAGEQDVQICEKVDGAQMGFSIDENFKIRAQNRSHYVTSQSHQQFKALDKWIYHHQEALYKVLDQDHILFGEWMYATHSIAYDSLPDYFLAYDLFNKIEGKFYSRDILEARLQGTNIFMVREIYRGKIKKKQDILEMLQMPTAYATQGRVEGVYLKIFEGDYVKERSKIVRTDFLSGNEFWTRGGMKQNVVRYHSLEEDSSSCTTSMGCGDSTTPAALWDRVSMAKNMFGHEFVMEAKKGIRQKYTKEENVRLACQLKGLAPPLRMEKVKGDGNCLFRSLANQLANDEEQHTKFRRCVVEFIKSQRVDFEAFVDNNEGLDTYCDRMMKDGQWGGHLELVAAARLWNAAVEVHRLGERPLRIEGEPGGRVLRVSYHGAEHYNSVSIKRTLASYGKPPTPEPTVATLREELMTLQGTQNSKKRKQLKDRIAKLELDAETLTAVKSPVPSLMPTVGYNSESSAAVQLCFQPSFDPGILCSSDEVAQEQKNEIEALSAIYDEAFEMKGSLPSSKGDACACFAFILKGDPEDTNSNIKLHIQFQEKYPQEKRGIKCRLEHAAWAGITPELEKLLLIKIHSELDQLEEGDPCGCLVIAAAEEWLREHLSSSCGRGGKGAS